MAFTDKQIFDAIEKNEDVKNCFNKIINACKELKSNNGCPDDVWIVSLNLLLVSGFEEVGRLIIYF